MKVLSYEKQISLYAILGFVCFIGIYPLDGIKLLASKLILLPPFGFIAFVFSLFLIVPFLSVKRTYFVNIWIVIFYSIVLGLIVLTISSQYFEWIDLWTYFKLFIAAPLVGYFTIVFLKLEKVTNNVIYFTLSLLCVLSITVIYFYFNRSLFLDINYLSFAEGILLVSIFLMVYLKSTKHKLILTIIVLVLLFMSDSRFIFFSFLLISFIYFSLNSLRILFKLSIFFLVSLFIIMAYDPNILLESRFARLLLYTYQDTSLTSRNELLSTGFFVTEFYSISGKYAYFREYCNGCYTHNLLSLWFEFGLIGVCFIVFLIGSLLIGAIASFKIILNKHLNNKAEIFYFLLVIHSLIGFIFSKHWTYITLFLVLGMTFYIINNKDHYPSNTNKY